MANDRRLTTTESALYESLGEGLRLEDLLRALGWKRRERDGEGRSHPSRRSDDS